MPKYVLGVFKIEVAEMTPFSKTNSAEPCLISQLFKLLLLIKDFHFS